MNYESYESTGLILVWVDPSSGLTWHSLNKDGDIAIGRDDDNDVIIGDKSVSGVHAVFRKTSEDMYELADQDSTNGTFVNEVEIDHCGCQVSLGDVASFGMVRTIVANREFIHHIENLENVWRASMQEGSPCSILTFLLRFECDGEGFQLRCSGVEKGFEYTHRLDERTLFVCSFQYKMLKVRDVEKYLDWFSDATPYYLLGCSSSWIRVIAGSNDAGGTDFGAKFAPAVRLSDDVLVRFESKEPRYSLSSIGDEKIQSELMTHFTSGILPVSDSGGVVHVKRHPMAVATMGIGFGAWLETLPTLFDGLMNKVNAESLFDGLMHVFEVLVSLLCLLVYEIGSRCKGEFEKYEVSQKAWSRLKSGTIGSRLEAMELMTRLKIIDELGIARSTVSDEKFRECAEIAVKTRNEIRHGDVNYIEVGNHVNEKVARCIVIIINEMKRGKLGIDGMTLWKHCEGATDRADVHFHGVDFKTTLVGSKECFECRSMGMYLAGRMKDGYKYEANFTRCGRRQPVRVRKGIGRLLPLRD